jgi:hypothetical protein
MPGTVALSIIVFARGLSADQADIRLSQASKERVDALAAYIEGNLPSFRAKRAHVVFSGGWSAVDGVADGNGRHREARLMHEYAESLSIAGKSISFYADTYTESESDSTLENVLRVKENGYFRQESLTGESPLGIVAHKAQLKRVRYLVCRVFGLQSDEVVDIIATGEDVPDIGIPESLMLIFTRLALLGASSHASFRRRHRLLLRAYNITRFKM